MWKVLDEHAKVKIDGRWHDLKAVLVGSVGGSRIEYLDADGCTIHSEAFSRSKYRNAKIAE